VRFRAKRSSPDDVTVELAKGVIPALGDSCALPTACTVCPWLWDMLRSRCERPGRF
jgi:hypothetical protein